MKTMFFAFALGVAALSSDAATASTYRIHPRPEDREMSAYPGASSSPRRLFHSGSECGADRASSVQDSNGNMLGYECLSSPNGS